MGGSSNQVTGYRYFANFLLFIGNPIEKVLGINFDKRGWETGKRVPMGTNGELCYLHLPNLYGENEGGVSGVLNIKHGSKMQTVDSAYIKYMNSISLPASAYPYQSYISFSGSELASQFQGMTDEELQDLADEYEDGIVPGKGFYLGNSGYMKEMLLWPKRTRVRNDGREQWYKLREDGAIVCEINANLPDRGMAFLETHWELRATGPGVDGVYPTIDGMTKRGVFKASDPTRIYNINLRVRALVELRSVIGGESIGTYIKKGGESGEKSTFNVYTLSVNDDVYFLNAGVSDFSLVSYEDIININIKNNDVIVLNVSTHDAEMVSSYQSLSVSIDLSNKGVEMYDINPIHKIREILTDDTAMNKPESDINDVNFMKAADRIWDEGLGISWSITEKSCLDAINELCSHIEAGVRINRQTGLYEIVLFRDNWFEENEIHTLAVSKIKSMSLEIVNADEVVNQLNVSYYNRDAIKNSSFSISENASIRNLNGRVNAEDADFPYFMNQRNAAVVAQWKLKQMSSPVWKGSFTTAEYNARKWNRYDLLKLAWPRKWQGEITVRIMKINLGTGADVSIDFVEVVPYSSNLSSDIVIDEPIDTTPQPPLPCQYEPFEMPYYLAVMALGQRQVDEELGYENNFGLVGVVAEQPQSNSLYAVMMTHDGTEGEEWLRAATINYEPVTELDQAISRTSATFAVKDATAILNLAAGTLIKCGSEWMVFQHVDQNTSIMSVKRGALDSIPQNQEMGAKLYFCGNDVAFDPTEYVAGEEVFISALTTTPSGVLEQRGSIPVEMQARAIRPYPPANVMVNGQYFPTGIEGDLLLTWVDRNRIQQTGGEIIGWYDGSVTLETDVTYQLILIERDENNIELRTQNLNLGNVNTYTLSVLAMDTNVRTIEIVLKSLRDGYECAQPFIHNVQLSQFFSEPYDLTVEFKND